MSTVAVTDATFDAEVKNSDIPVVVDFWAEWCGPCKQIGPALEELAVEYGGKIKVAKVDVDSNPNAAAAMGVDVVRTKVIAFTLTGVLAGIAGIVFAFVDNTVNPSLFSIENAFMLLFMVIVGGTGRHAGAIVGAVLLFLANPILEPYIGTHTQLVFGLIVLGAILFQREGLIGLYDQAAAVWQARRGGGR